jgi:nicotinate-nucleotide adenylyltransferase
LAHAEIVEQVKAQLGADLVVVVPCGKPVHKLYTGEAKHRFEMAKLAFGNMKRVLISNFEIKKKQKSYSLFTIKHFRRKYKNCELFFVIGSDSLEDFPNWYKPEEIAQLATIVVVPRANHDFRKARQFFEKNYKTKLILFDGEPLNISATELRIMTEFELDTSDFLDGKVVKYIKDNKLYSEFTPLCVKSKKFLKKARLTHTVYTVQEGLRLAKINRADSEKVFVACALHDIGKNVSPGQWARFGFSNDENLPEGVIHAALGAKIAEKEFGITDETVLNAIRYHTTARPSMVLEEKIVYVADMVEISRNGMGELRKKVETDFEQGFLLCLKKSYNFAVEQHGAADVSSLTKKSINYYRKEIKEKNEKSRLHSANVQSAVCKTSD